MTNSPIVAAGVGRLSIVGHRIFDRASWTLIDQGIVSLGGFILNVQLARCLPGADYGAFALFMGAVFMLRAVDFSLISFPLSVRLGSLTRDEHPTAIANTAVLAVVLSACFAVALGLGTILLGRSDIALAVTVCYLAWQAQEMTRRFLTADYRYRAASWGDATSFLGQAAAIAVLSYVGALTLESALYAIAALFLAGALVHLSKLTLARPRVAELRDLSRQYYQLGKWSILTYEVVLLRTQLYPWALAVVAGTAATASFQAALNIANLMNPIILGIGTVIPQAAAQARRTHGLTGAWHVARGYILFGLPLVVVFAAFGLLAPNFALQTLYGPDSPFLDLATCVQLLALAWACEYVGEMIAKTLLGADLGGYAFLVNSTGAVGAIVALPLVIPFGVLGASVALAIANLVRLVFAALLLAWLLAKESALEGARADVPAE